MTHRYKIADYLTREEKLRVVEAEYEWKTPVRLWATKDGNCPLGVAFPQLHKRPSSAEVARLLVSEGRYAGPIDTPLMAALDLIAAWDSGEIEPHELAVVLGLVAESTHATTV